MPHDGDQPADVLHVAEEVRVMGVAGLGELRQLRQENQKPKQLVADRSLDKHMLQDVRRRTRGDQQLTR